MYRTVRISTTSRIHQLIFESPFGFSTMWKTIPLTAICVKCIIMIIFQEYTHDEAAQMLGCWRRTIGRRFAEALDRLSGFLLDAGLLLRLPDATSKAQKSCQEGENIEIPVSDSEEGK